MLRLLRMKGSVENEKGSDRIFELLYVRSGIHLYHGRPRNPHGHSEVAEPRAPDPLLCRHISPFGNFHLWAAERGVSGRSKYPVTEAADGTAGTIHPSTAQPVAAACHADDATSNNAAADAAAAAARCGSELWNASVH